MQLMTDGKPHSKYKRIMASLYPLEEIPKDLWSLDLHDKQNFACLLITIILVWFASLSSGEIGSFMGYWDGPNYVYAAKSLYNIPSDYPWKREFGYQPSYFACHLPGFPLIISFFATITFNNYWIGDMLAIITCSLLCSYAFRRLLIVYNAVSKPHWTALLFTWLPLRFIVYKSVGASEPLYSFYVYMSLICFKINNKILMLFSLWGACITRIEGLSIVGTIGLSYLLRLDIIGAIITSFGFLATASMFYLHHIKFGDWKSYFKFNQGRQKLLHFPFFSLVYDSNSVNKIPRVFKVFDLFLPMLTGTLIIYTISIPIAIFCTVYILYVSSLNHMDTFRYALPAYTLTLLIGFDMIWSSKKFKQAAPFLSIIYSVFAVFYVVGQVVTNRCDRDFLKDIMNPKSP